MAKKKKWSKDECRDRYVLGEAIGIRGLAKISGVSHATLGRWSSNENWTCQRQQHEDTIRTAADSKIVKKKSTAIAERYTELETEHLKGFELFRKASQQFGAILLADIQKASKDNSDRKAKIMNANFSLAMQRYSGIFAEMAKMERLVTGADYQTIDKAIAFVTKEGFDVTNPSSEMMAEFLRAEGYIVEKKEEKQITQSA